MIEICETLIEPYFSINLSAKNLTMNCAKAPKVKANPFMNAGVENTSLIKIIDHSIPAPSISIAERVNITKASIPLVGIIKILLLELLLGRLGHGM